MEDFCQFLNIREELHDKLERMCEQYLTEVQILFSGTTSPTKDATLANLKVPEQCSVAASPQQTKKRAKRLTALEEDADAEGLFTEELVTEESESLEQSSHATSMQLSTSADVSKITEKTTLLNSTATLMPPPPAPEASSARPTRAAKNAVKTFKEPSLIGKLRRPSKDAEVNIKLEHEQRLSQFVNASEDLVSVEAPNKSLATVQPVSEETETANAEDSKKLRVKIKREKVSTGGESSATLKDVEIFKTPMVASAPVDVILPSNETVENTVLSSTVSVNTTAADVSTKKGRKKKDMSHKPIKVERFSDIDKSSPIATRTRKGSHGNRKSDETQKTHRSVYEDAVENLTPPAQDATFKIDAVPNANMTTTISKNVIASDETFNVASEREDAYDEHRAMDSKKSTETAERMESFMTEDNSFERETPSVKVSTNSASTKGLPVPQLSSGKPYKMPTRTHELFNPLVQSPVKMRVEAFENAAQAASEGPRKNTRSKMTKENATPNSSTTPVIGKLPPPTLGRFLTPTQSSNIAPLSSAHAKKAPMSASKATSLTKTATGTNLKSTNSGSIKTISRENSGDDFRKGLHQLAEERKKQREQKHLLAAQQREAKERERAERMAKLAKEREEKRLRKVQEQEQKKREMEEINRKLKQQEEAEAAKKAKAKAALDQERELLLLKQQQAKSKVMMPPPPKAQSKYTFEMLHEDDSTDDEGKVSYKRPPVPSWSRSHVRGPAILMQQYFPTSIIDSFFSLEPSTPDLKEIFPNIDSRYLQRNSSVLWSTPPRYSELPKY